MRRITGTLLEDRYGFLIVSHSFLRMRNFACKFVEKAKTSILCQFVAQHLNHCATAIPVKWQFGTDFSEQLIGYVCEVQAVTGILDP